MTKVLEIIREATLIILGIIFSSCIVVLADCNSTVSSQDVSYDNSTIKAELDTILNDLESYRNVSNSSFKTALLNAFYPVGSIYISTSSTNPGTSIGGTWVAFGQGRTLVGVGSNGTTNYSTVEATGGNESQSYTPQITYSIASGAISNHTFTPASANGKLVGPTIADHTYSLTAGSNKTGATTLTIDQLPDHVHEASDSNYKMLAIAKSGSGTSRTGIGRGTDPSYWFINSSGVVARNLTGTSAVGGGQPHSHDVTESPVTITHTVNSPTFTGAQATLTHTITANATFSGNSVNISHVQSYTTVYMWKRTA